MKTLLAIDRAASQSSTGDAGHAEVFGGLDGEAWPDVDATEEPVFPQAFENAPRWLNSISREGVDLVYVSDEGDRPVVPTLMFEFLGYDVGYVNEFWSLFSSVLNDLVWRDIGLSHFRGKLNGRLLFNTLNDANTFVSERRALEAANVDVEPETDDGRLSCLAVYRVRWSQN